VRIIQADLEIQREPFARPFAFKGASFNEKWNLVVRLVDEQGNCAYGVGGLAVLWSDAAVFAAHTETGGNVLQTVLLERGLQLAQKGSWSHPLDLFEEIWPQVYAYGTEITGRKELRPTFALNALVALDNAAWMLWARRRGVDDFTALLPQGGGPLLAARQGQVAAVPAVGYNMPLDQVESLVEDGVCMLKVKIGQPGDAEEMLQKDMAWLERLHRQVGGRDCAGTKSGRVLYYLDANGRYPGAGHLERLLDHLEALGALGQVALVEEPFDETVEDSVGHLPVMVAADESLHHSGDVERRRQLGYGAVAVKAAGKSLSVAWRMLEAAVGKGMCCFVADNACVPWLVEWNKNIAARLPAFPGVDGGIMETNGAENYGRRWESMLDEMPCAGAGWLRPQRGFFRLNEDYYRASGGIFSDPTPYVRLFRQDGVASTKDRT
jgi:L-alanine-DL-glutamate epimerase-like enolase superfamily enzyme